MTADQIVQTARIARNRDVISGSSHLKSVRHLTQWAVDTGHSAVIRRPYRGYPGRHVVASLADKDGQPDPKSGFTNLIHLGSYNYSGLNEDPRIRDAAKRAIDEYGVSTSGVRLLNGTTELHLELEDRLARFVGMEAALTYSSGYSANVSTLAALCAETDIVFSDELNHKSIVDGLKLSQASVVKFRHRDSAHLKALLQGTPVLQRKFIVTDGVFSMDGDIAKLDELVELANEFNCFIIVDDAHATAAIGPNGRGTAAHFGLESEVDLVISSLSKGLPGIGGFAAGSKRAIDALRYGSNAYIFSASLPPSVCAGLIKAIEILETEPEIQSRLHANEAYLRENIHAFGLDVMHSETPIIPILVKNRDTAYRFARYLHEHGVFANPVSFPAVSLAKSRLRLNASSTLTLAEMDRALEAIEAAARLAMKGGEN